MPGAAQEAKSGRVYDCGKRSVAGFPFRLEVRCDDASVSLVSQTAGGAGAVHRAARRNPGGGADLRSEIADRRIQGAGHDRRSRPAAVAEGELEPRPQQRGRPAGRSAARLDRVRQSLDRSRQRAGADAARARQPCRTARPARGRIGRGKSRDRNRAADRGRQRAGSASAAGGAVRCRRADQAERLEGFFAKAVAGAFPRNPGRGRPCRDRAVADSAGRSDRGCRRHAGPQRAAAGSTANCR